MRQEVRKTLELLGLGWVEHAHHVVLAVSDVFLNQEYRRRDKNHDHGHCGSEIRVRARLADPLLIDDNRQGAVTFANQPRRAVIGERAQEHDGRAGQNRRQNKRQAHLEHFADAVVAQALRRLAQRSVHLLERAFRIHIDIREELEHKNQQHAAEAVDARHGNADCLKQLRDFAVAAQHQNPGVRAQKGRRQHGDDDQNVDQPVAANLERRGDVGQRNANQNDQNRRAGDHLDAVKQRRSVILAGEEFDKVIQRNRPVAGLQRIDEHPRNRDHQKQPEEYQRE